MFSVFGASNLDGKNGQDSYGRDMKTLQEQTEEKATQISTVNTHSSNQPYLDGWECNDTTVGAQFSFGRTCKLKNGLWLRRRSEERIVAVWLRKRTEKK
ncbi:uncharacterized protein G2W53_040795 [Senna tora]|uniref:Uncharacterized protein n=1 Tax=Senna tora TaxID=362788 RepID=A0A834SE84_9FABA|nr:uncharacterized protein G2W53_040795 [Senna tora]